MRKETVKGGAEGQALKQAVGNWGNGTAAPKPAAPLCRNQLRRCVSLGPGWGSSVFTRSSWANRHSAIVHVVETIPEIRRVCAHPVTLPQMTQDAFQLWLGKTSPTLPQTGMLETIVITHTQKKDFWPCKSISNVTPRSSRLSTE